MGAMKQWNPTAFREAMAAYPPAGMSMRELHVQLSKRMRGKVPSLQTLYLQYRLDGSKGPAVHQHGRLKGQADEIAETIARTLRVPVETMWADNKADEDG
jgi:hypothetical protein